MEFYCRNVEIARKCTEGDISIPRKEQENQKQMSLYFFNEKEGDWETRRIEIDRLKKELTFKFDGKQINLHKYIVRNSKKKDRRSIALESTLKNQEL